MKPIFSPLDWIPLVWILLQSYLILFIIIFFLRRFRILKTPVSGMEYSQVAAAMGLLLGGIFISTGDISSIFQSAKILQNGTGNVFQNMLSKYSEYFLMLIAVMSAYLTLGILNNRIFFRETKKDGSDESNLPLGVLVAAINLGLSVVCWFCFKELAETFTPVFVNFR